MPLVFQDLLRRDHSPLGVKPNLYADTTGLLQGVFVLNPDDLRVVVLRQPPE